MKLIRHSIIALSLIGASFTSCKKDCDTHPVAVEAGDPQTIQLAVSSLNMLARI